MYTSEEIQRCDDDDVIVRTQLQTVLDATSIDRFEKRLMSVVFFGLRLSRNCCCDNEAEGDDDVSVLFSLNGELEQLTFRDCTEQFHCESELKAINMM